MNLFFEQKREKEKDRVDELRLKRSHSETLFTLALSDAHTFSVVFIHM